MCATLRAMQRFTMDQVAEALRGVATDVDPVSTQLMAGAARPDQREFLARILGQYSIRARMFSAVQLAQRALPVDVLSAGSPVEVVRSLLRWFKDVYMRPFVSTVACGVCGSGDTVASGAGDPTREERERGDAQLVELHRCSACASVTRFPRFNNPAVLMETRLGRCGEVSFTVALCCLCSLRL